MCSGYITKSNESPIAAYNNLKIAGDEVKKNRAKRVFEDGWLYTKLDNGIF